MRLFDTHCHLDDDQFDKDRADVIDRAAAVGLMNLLAVGTTANSSACCCDLADAYSLVRAAVGIQPNYVAEAEAGDWDLVEELVSRERVIAIGETGLDRYWDYTPFDLQQEYFDRHLRLSQRTALPFIVHMRDCEQDIVTMLEEARQRGPLSGVMHSFTGSAATAERCLDLGLYISFAGMVTYKKSSSLREIASQVPRERILIETDAPYLSPHPKRGQRPNEPALIVHTAECLAEVCQMPLADFAEQTTSNACTLFRL